MADLASEVRVEEESRTNRSIAASGVLALAMLGISERGPIGESTLSNSFAEWEKQHGGHTAETLDTVEAVRGYFDGGGTILRFGRVVHTTTPGDPTTKTSAAGTLELMTTASAPAAGSVDSVAQPFNLEPAQTLIVKIDGGGDQTFTFAAAAAELVSGAETFNITDGQTLTFVVNGGTLITKTFGTAEFVSIAAATAEEVVASLNAFFAANNAGCAATVTGGGTTVTVTTVRRGTGASLTIGGTAAALGALIGTDTGTGDAADIDAVTAAEAATKLSTLTGGVAAAVSGALRITSSTTGGSSSVQVTAPSTADTAFGFDNAVHSGNTGAAVATATADGKTDGAYANELSIQIADATNGESESFNLYVVRNGVVKERWFNLTMDSASLRYAPTLINDTLSGSDYITFTDEEAATSLPRPANGTLGPLTGGDDGLSGLSDTDYTGGETSNGSTGVRVFDVDDIDVVIAPGRATSAVHNGLLTYCEVHRAGLCFTILDPPRNYSAAQMVTYVESTANLLELSDKGAIYWPNVKVANPNKDLYGTDAAIVIAPSGHLAGMYARNDARKTAGQFQQPAGTEYGRMPGVLGLEMSEVKKKTKRDLVFPKMINPISQERGTPIFVDGARTLKSSSPFPSVGQRRGVIFMEKQLIPGLAFIRHQNINERLYEQGNRTLQVFLLELTRNDAFKSKDPKKAFFIDIGPGLNSASVQAQKKVQARIGVATSEPAEFVVLLVGPDTRALDEELAALAA
jgi:hypothetical protein